MVSNKEKKALTELGSVFDEQKDEVNVWKPKTVNETIVGRILDMGVSGDYGTTNFSLETKDDDIPTIVYIKKGLENIFLRAGFFKRNADNNIVWADKISELEGSLIAFRFEGKKTNEKTGRQFEAYKVSFEDQLPPSVKDLFA